jgi:hypothetical protein
MGKTMAEQCKTFHCPKCNQSFQGKYAKYSLKTHDGYCGKDHSMYTCDHCSKSFKKKVGLKNHMVRWHELITNISCQICNKTFADNSKLQKHMTKHSSDRPVKCNSCDKTFKQQSSLITHNKKHNGEENDPFPCKLCQKYYTSKGGLKKHEQKHHQSLSEEKNTLVSNLDKNEPKRNKGRLLKKPTPKMSSKNRKLQLQVVDLSNSIVAIDKIAEKRALQVENLEKDIVAINEDKDNQITQLQMDIVSINLDKDIQIIQLEIKNMQLENINNDIVAVAEKNALQVENFENDIVANFPTCKDILDIKKLYLDYIYDVENMLEKIEQEKSKDNV